MKALLIGVLSVLGAVNVWSQNINPITDRKIYGFADSFFVSTDLNTLQRDTLIAFTGTPWINLDFRASIDQFNGYYYFLGTLPGYSGTFHVIDLVDLTIESTYGFSPAFKHNTGYLEYDFLRNRVLYDLSHTVRSVDLETNKHRQILGKTDKNFNISGQASTYMAGSNEFLMLVSETGEDFKGSYLSLNGYSGQTICDTDVERENDIQLAASSFVHNLYSQKVYAHRNERFGTASYCNGTVNWDGSVSEYHAVLNSQMAVLNHVNETYIFPYMSTNKKEPYKIAIVDIVTDSVLRILNQPWDGKMQLHQIYDKPQAPLYLQNDTLFVPKGLSYKWYLDDVFIGSSTDNYWVPSKTGHYTAEVEFREYTSTSKKVGIWNTSIPKKEHSALSVYPNPASDQVKINSKIIAEGEVQVIDDLGRVCLTHFVSKGSQNTSLNLSSLVPGMYSVVLVTEQATFHSGRFIKL